MNERILFSTFVVPKACSTSTAGTFRERMSASRSVIAPRVGSVEVGRRVPVSLQAAIDEHVMLRDQSAIERNRIDERLQRRPPDCGWLPGS